MYNLLTIVRWFRNIELADKQIQKIADILADIGTVIAASAIIPSIFYEFHLAQMIVGLIGSILFWFLSIKFSNSWNR